MNRWALRFLKQRLILAIVLTAASTGSSVSKADSGQVDLNTMDTVISRLETALPGLQGNAARARVLARLGDLHSDRARLRDIEAVKTNCKRCHGAEDDRQIAVSDYQKALALTQLNHQALTPEQSAELLTQTAYLYSLLGQHNKANQVFTRIIERKQVASSAELIGEAYAGRGELSFDAAEFAKAQRDYEHALRYPLRNKNLVQYRLAWCEFNAGRDVEAKDRLIRVLRSPMGANEPVSFRHDMARDLVTFVARGKITPVSIDELMSVTPPSDRNANLFYLGQEADRLGNHDGALLVWNIYSSKAKANDADSLEMQIRIAQAIWDEGRVENSLHMYQTFLRNFSSQNCAALENCDVLKARAREYVVVWLKRNKLHPTPALLAALEDYTSLFGNRAPAGFGANDAEMIEWTGHIARRLKQYSVAANEYHLAADKSAAAIADKHTDSKKLPVLRRTLESSLLAEIECAEQSNVTSARETAYHHYLALLPNGPKVLEVRYQIAYLEYQAGNFAEASNEFRSIAVARAASPSERTWQEQAAHLSLRANVDQAVAQGSTGKYQAALEQLKSTPLTYATAQEKTRVYKNQIILAKKLNDVQTVATAGLALECVHKLTKRDRRFALENELWADEMQMNFTEAFRVARDLSHLQRPTDESRLRLALLAELSGHNSALYYRQYLAHSRNIHQSNLIRAKIVRESYQPWRTLAKYRRELRHTPEIYGASVLECFARQPDNNNLKKYLADRAIRRSSQYEALKRYQELADDRKLDRQLRAHWYRVTPARMRFIHRTERLANSAARRHDFVLEVVDLNRVAREYSQLANDLRRAPIPRHLRRAQRMMYQRLLNKKVAQYQSNVIAIDRQLSAIWRSGRALNALASLAQSDLGVTRRLVVRDLKTVLPFAPTSEKSRIVYLIAQAETNPNRTQIAEARSAVRQNPFDLNRVVELKRLESRRGDTSMVVFLDARLAQNKFAGAVE